MATRQTDRMLNWVIGALLVLLIFLFNPVTIGRAISSDGLINIVSLRSVLWIFSAALFVAFCLFVRNPGGLRSHFRLNYKNYLLLGVSVFFAMAMTEAALRIRNGLSKSIVYYVNNYEYDYSYSQNSSGFRDDEFAKAKKKDVFRVFLIGDSFVKGVGVDTDNTIDRLLEKKFKTDDVACEVFNLGWEGKAPSAYLEVAKQFKEYNPDLVIVSLYTDNDIESTPTEEGHFRLNPIKELIMSLEITKRLDNFLNIWNKRYIYPWTEKYASNSFYSNLVRKNEINIWIPFRASYVNSLGGNQAYYDRLTDIFNSDQFTGNNILAMRQIYKDVPFLLVINPSQYQVDPGHFEEVKKIGVSYRDAKLVDRKLQDAIISWADKNKIDYVDVLRGMKEGAGGPFFYKIDPHYNPRGSRLAADMIYNKLKEMGVPKR